MERLCMFSLLAICGWTDHKTGRIPILILIFYGVFGIILYFQHRSVPLEQEAAGICIGVAILLIGKATRESIGYGDGLLLMVTGCYLGLVRNFQLFMGSLILTAFWSVTLIIGKRESGKKEIPFAPFLLFAYIGMALL